MEDTDFNDGPPAAPPMPAPAAPPAKPAAKGGKKPPPAKPARKPASAAPAPEQAPAPPGRPARFRVSLPHCTVKVRCPVQETYSDQPHLDVEVSAAEAAADGGDGSLAALRKFAQHNGIPMATDSLRGTPRLASEHPPRIERLTDYPA